MREIKKKGTNFKGKHGVCSKKESIFFVETTTATTKRGETNEEEAREVVKKKDFWKRVSWLDSRLEFNSDF